MIEPRTEIVLPGKPMAATLQFFRETLGFRLLSILPADDPREAVVVAPGLRVLLDRDFDGAPGLLRQSSERPRAPLQAPNGTQIQFVTTANSLVIPAPGDAAVIHAAAEPNGTDHAWVTGRAGMLYRDLIPGRMQGHLIASHIRIPDGGPVPDDVHFHDVRFQLIYCYRGWVSLVYEDQGEPFVMQPGDCVLQPPQIRHRVLEASDGLEVIELACPSAHLTSIDHELQLPTATVRRDRDFGGQRFHWHRHQNAQWHNDGNSGWSIADLGIGEATKQLAEVAVLRAAKDATMCEAKLCFYFVQRGTCELSIGTDSAVALQRTDAATVPAGTPVCFANCSADLELLRVGLR